VRATPNREMATDWWVSRWGGGVARCGSTAVELAQWSPMMWPKSYTTGGEREEGEVGIKEGGRGAG
jgi:hypothetical protein